MGAACTICNHEDREAIDAMIVGGAPNRAVARNDWPGGAVSKDAVLRHRSSHISSGVARVMAEREAAGPRSALDRMEELYTEARELLASAREDGKASLQLGAIRELRGIVETLAKITGELDERTQVQVLNLSTNPDFVAMLGTLMDALGPYPEVREVVARRLELEGPS